MLVKIGSSSASFSLSLVTSFFFPFAFNFLSCYCRFCTKDKRIFKQKVTLTRNTNQITHRHYFLFSMNFNVTINPRKELLHPEKQIVQVYLNNKIIEYVFLNVLDIPKFSHNLNQTCNIDYSLSYLHFLADDFARQILQLVPIISCETF